MTLVLPVVAASAADRTWRGHLVALAAVMVVLLALFARDAGAVVATWWTSTTFEHCFVVLGLIAWLIWQRRTLLARLEPTGWAPGLAIVAAGGTAWLVGAAATVTFARQLGLLVMLEGAVVTLLGPRVARGLAFPLGYAFFLVPFGEWLEAPLQLMTVRLAMPLLALVGVPATSNGVMIHAGRYWFEVAEACSGAKFVIAMVAFAVLAANLCFTRWPRRIAFLAAAVVVPVLANGVRAAMTIWIANLTSVEAASGFDHIVYGWVWFGVVMAAVIAIGWRWFDRPVDAPAFEPPALAGPVGAPLRPWPAAALAIGIAASFMLWGMAALARTTPLPDRLALPDVPGWHRVPLDPSAPWRPSHPGADHQLIGRYADTHGEVVDLAVALYPDQGEGRNVLAYGSGAAGEEPWRRVADLAPIAGASAMRIAAPGPVERIATTRYLVAGTATSSPPMVKLATLRARLFGGSQQVAAIHLSTRVAAGQDPTRAIERFAAAMPADPVATAR